MSEGCWLLVLGKISKKGIMKEGITKSYPASTIRFFLYYNKLFIYFKFLNKNFLFSLNDEQANENNIKTSPLFYK